MTISDILSWHILGGFEIMALLLALAIIYENIRNRITDVFLYIIPLILILFSGLIIIMVQLFDTSGLTCAMIGIETEMDKETVILIFLILGFIDCCAVLWYYGRFGPESNNLKYRNKKERRQALYKVLGLILLNAGWFYLFKNLFFITVREVYGFIYTTF